MEKSIATREYRIFLRCLRATRKRLGVTQVQMADRLGQTQSWVSKCERGERRLDLVEARTFCTAMGAPFLEFVREFEEAVIRRQMKKK
jgi:transcriptional regulator with XRE-family HTH domain